MLPNTSPFQSGDKVVCYCRYSEGDDQGLKNTSVDEQEQAIRQFCDLNGIELVMVFADPFASGRSVAKRDKYLEMLSFLLHGKKKDIQGVILWDYERYGRNYDRAQYDAAQLRMKGYKLFSMQQPIVDNSPFSHVLESMYFASAQNQSDMISADVKRALQSNFTKYKVIPRTNIPDGWIPIPVKMGYLTDGRERIGYRAEPDPEYKYKIRDAVQARLDGATMKQVRKILGGKFEKVAIKSIALFAKPLLYGSLTYGGTTMDDYCEPIIDKETFDKLQIYNEAQPKRRRSAGAGVFALNRSLLSGLLICGECGGRMYLDTRKAKGHTYQTYYCSGYHIGVRREVIEDMIIDKAIELLSGDQWERDMNTLLEGMQDDSASEINRSAIEKEIRDIDRKLERICDTLLMVDTPPETLVNKMNILEARKKELLAELNASEGEGINKIREMADKSHSRILSVLQSPWSTTDEKREALSLFIPEIVIFPETNKKLRVIVKHGIPSFLEVASDFGSKLLRPSSEVSYTRNLLTDTFIIDRR